MSAVGGDDARIGRQMECERWLVDGERWLRAMMMRDGRWSERIGWRMASEPQLVVASVGWRMTCKYRDASFGGFWGCDVSFGGFCK